MSNNPQQDASIGVNVQADQGLQALEELKRKAEKTDQTLQKLKQTAISHYGAR